MKKLFFLTIVFGVLFAVFAVEWHVDVGANNQVKFISKAETFIKTFEFEGVTDKIDGYFYWDDEQLFQNSEFYFEVDLASFDTGIGKRNRDMREMVLETDKYPVASYRGTVTQFMAIDSLADTYSVTTRGKLSLHGVEREVEIPGRVFVSNNFVNIQAEFDVLLPGYQIKVPSILVAKVAEDIHLVVKVRLKKAASEE